MLNSTLGLEKSSKRYPVVVIPGHNHASFLTGTPPPTV
jgi:hypothetical protein